MILILNILILKKWYIINDENITNYGINKDTGADNPDTIKYDTRTTNAVNATRFALKNCAPFTKCNLEINDEHVDTA